MAQAQPEKEIQGIGVKNDHDMTIKEDSTSSSSGAGASFKFNALAPEFVPTRTMPTAAAAVAATAASSTTVPISGYFVPCFQYLGGGSGGDDQWVFVGDQEAIPLVANANVVMQTQKQQEQKQQQTHAKNSVLTPELQQKLIKQVEYQFSDLSLLANENLVKHIHKDPEGFVPIAFVASTKKLKTLINSNHTMLAQALRASLKLDVSGDGKRVKRKKPFTDKEKEELQSRTVVAENLPDDHSHQNIEKIFNVAGSVKTIRICHPQEASNRGKADQVISTKLHALVEYENIESAERAVEKLNDERNWRKGLRVRLLLRLSPKSVLKSRKSDFDDYLDDDEGHPVVDSHSHSHFQAHQNNSEPTVVVSDNIASVASLSFNRLLNNDVAEDSAAASKKVWSKGRGKPRHQSNPSYGSRGLLSQSSLTGVEASSKQTIKGPRMPDGTRGFNMGRGKPISVPA